MSKILKTAIAAAAGVLTAGAAFCAVNKHIHKDICMLAHRGYSSKYSGNTEPAVLGAVKNGSGGIETDVRVTKDAIFVVNRFCKTHTWLKFFGSNKKHIFIPHW